MNFKDKLEKLDITKVDLDDVKTLRELMECTIDLMKFNDLWGEYLMNHRNIIDFEQLNIIKNIAMDIRKLGELIYQKGDDVADKYVNINTAGIH